MQRPDNPAIFHSAMGVVEGLDLPGRSLAVRVDGRRELFDVPPECPIHLHGEAVKLRLLQPADFVHVVYTHTPEGRTAHLLRVNWWLPGTRVAATRSAAQGSA